MKAIKCVKEGSPLSESEKITAVLAILDKEIFHKQDKSIQKMSVRKTFKSYFPNQSDETARPKRDLLPTGLDDTNIGNTMRKRQHQTRTRNPSSRSVSKRKPPVNKK
jgi:hypothetical protein